MNLFKDPWVDHKHNRQDPDLKKAFQSVPFCVLTEIVGAQVCVWVRM